MNKRPLPLLRPQVFRRHDSIVAAFSTREGGVSPHPHRSLNLGNGTADDASNVEENRRLLLRSLGFDLGQLATGGQVHGARVRTIAEPGFYEATDGLVTDVGGLVLAIQAADCAAVLLADPAASVIAACHAGWRGAVGGIVDKTLQKMEKLGASREQVLAYVSPCISVACFEVGPEVGEQFDSAHVHHPEGAPRPFVDLKSAILGQLEAAGVASSHVEVSPHCTASETETFYSHRAEDGITGRMMGVIGLK